MLLIAHSLHLWIQIFEQLELPFLRPKRQIFFSIAVIFVSSYIIIFITITRFSSEKCIIKNANFLKMIVFKTHRRIFTLLCILPAPTNYGKKKKFFNIFLTIFAISSLLISLLASANYFVKFISSDLKSSMSAIFTTFITMGVLYTYLVAFINKRKIIKVLNGFQMCYESCKQWYVESNNRMAHK